MRICFCSDIHGNGLAWRAFWLDVEKRNPDLVVFGGDVCGYYYDTELIMRDLRENHPETVCLLGNHDQMFLDLIDGKVAEEHLVSRFGNSYQGIVEGVSPDSVAAFRKLNSLCEVQVDDLLIGFFHGGPEDALNMRIYPDTQLDDSAFNSYDFVFCGHTHHKMLRRLSKCVIVNPGSLGQQRDGQGCSYVMLDTCSCLVEFFSFVYDVDSLIWQVKSRETDLVIRDRLIEVLLRKRPPFHAAALL